MRLLFIGDIVGTPGLKLVRDAVPKLREKHALDFVIANAENIANGSGMYPSNYHALRRAGVDAVTMGDHIYKRAELISLLRHDEAIVRPANFPADAPGKSFLVLTTATGAKLAVVSLLGRLFMRQVDCPLRAIDALLSEVLKETNCILVDAHAEATGEKYQLLHHLKGRVSALLGTHTHVPTADEAVTAEGTAYISDVGMTGGHAGILGRIAKPILQHAFDLIPTTFEIEENDPRLNGAVVEIEDATGKAVKIERIIWKPLPE